MFSICFSGNVGGDVEFKYDKNGQPFCRFNVAISRGADEDPWWVRVTAFGKTAEVFAANTPTKGTRVLVQADRAPHIDIYEKRAGGVAVSTDIKATWIEVAGGHASVGKA